MEAEILLARAIDRSREWMLAHGDEPLAGPAAGMFASQVEKRARTGIPIAYLVGYREFAGLEFKVHPGVLVPRPETETLVEAVQDWLGGNGARFPSGLIVDAGCGSGIISVSLAKFTGRRVIATDISPVALETTSENAAFHGVAGLVDVRKGGWLGPVAAAGEPGDVCAVVSNPPYIPSAVIASLERDVRDFEPREALDGGADGLDSVRDLVGQASAVLPIGGLLAMEIGDDQAARVEVLLKEGGWLDIRRIMDMSGIFRVVMAEKGPNMTPLRGGASVDKVCQKEVKGE